MIKISGKDRTFDQGTIFNVSKEPGYGSTRKSVIKGKWYYEVTHYDGDNFCLIGFGGNSKYLAFYNKGSKTDFNFWTNMQLHRKEIKIEETFEEKYIIGIGLDLDNKIFLY